MLFSSGSILPEDTLIITGYNLTEDLVQYLECPSTAHPIQHIQNDEGKEMNSTSTYAVITKVDNI